jgi:porin
MMNRAARMMMPLVLVAGLGAAPPKAEEPAENRGATIGAAASPQGMISLVDMAPELYFQFRRYPKFYGDPNTTRGDLAQRSQMLGNAGGVRDSLVERGIYFDVSVTQFLQGNVSGGKESGDARYNGTADYWLTLDSGKAGLWPGGALFLHAESSWQANRSVNPDVGSLLPANYDATMPTPGVSRGIALPELYLAQGLPANWLLVLGKVDWSGLGDTNVFANNERTQFGYTGLVNNPILGAFIPYTSLGVCGVWQPTREHQLALLAIQSTGNATTSGFDNFNGNYTLGGQYQFSPTLAGGRPGNYRVLVGYNSKDVTDYAIDPRHLIGEIVGAVPVAQKSSNYALVLNFDQYLWVQGGGPVAGRKGLPPVGIGIFGRAGFAPKDRNVIDQFYSLGIGGFGALIPGRPHDQWGVGWSATHVSSDLRDDLAVLRQSAQAFEQGFEAFYNFRLTPAAHLTVNVQAVNSPVPSRDNAVTLGARLQLDL